MEYVFATIAPSDLSDDASYWYRMGNLMVLPDLVVRGVEFCCAVVGGGAGELLDSLGVCSMFEVDC